MASDPVQFNYTFDHIALVMNGFVQAMHLSHYTLYMQDYGGPVGFRMTLMHPECVQALIVQDAVAHVHLLDAGHFALDTKADEIARLVREFVNVPE